MIRPGDLVTPFFHFHTFTFEPCFRIHFGVRVMNDPFVALALNGPSLEHAGQYSEREEDIQNCIHEMVSYCRTEGLPWLERWSDPTALLEAQGFQAVVLSESLLGLRSGKNTAT